MITVAELIKALRDMPQDLEVLGFNEFMESFELTGVRFIDRRAKRPFGGEEYRDRHVEIW
jgi:hypothetical protein